MVTKLAPLNKTSYKTTLGLYLVHTKSNSDILPALAKKTPSEVYMSRPLEASARRFCRYFDAARLAVLQMNLANISRDGLNAVQASGTIHALRLSPEFMKDLGNLNDAAYAYWHSLPNNPQKGIYDLVKATMKKEDKEAYEAFKKDGYYWQSSRVFGSFIVLFDRPDGTVVVSQDLKKVYLVLGLEQTLGDVTNLHKRNGEYVRGAPYPPPKFHGPVLGTRITTTLLNWEGKILYDGLLSPESKPSDAILKKAIQAYAKAVDTNSLIVALEKKPVTVPKYNGFNSKAEFDQMLQELRPMLNEIQSYPATTSMKNSTWIAARNGLTIEENPNLTMCMVGGPGMALIPEFPMKNIVPSVQEYVELIYESVRMTEFKPHGVAVDADVRLEMLRGILEPTTGIKVLYFPPPSNEEREIAAKEIEEEMNEAPKCEVCSARKCPNGAKLMICSRCRKVYYCSQDHQKQHWKTHKQHCHA